ncbi:hypothetical protein HZS55_09875 [Halosimplex rubrum]|uniref:Uncharacterized protein n=1 Tax=Halosimplex rubrum TaxID=869889 RepID=A0A7D5P4S6_9EURY|nr:DUF6517 family protein [Halosimplex rubrum]QLH77585.1 hypothetical protein HZS55_09875 [Halosimplex rubrum]
MRRSRDAGIGIALVLLLATAGCIGFLTGSEPLGFAANATAVDDATLEETDYRLAHSASPNSTQNITVAGQTRQVVVSSELRRYNRTVTLAEGIEGDFARTTVFTSPAATVGGTSVNPIGSLSDERLVRRFVGTSSGLSNVEFRSNRSVEFLGDSRTVSEYAATRSMGGVQTNATVHLATVEHDGDFVTVVAVHPEAVDERSRVDALLAGLRHPPA